MKRALFVLVAGTIISGVAAFASSKPPAKVTLTRLDCGTVEVNDLNAFSDTDAYPGKTKTLAASCYLIRHGDDLMIWDAGLPAEIKGKAIDPKLPMDATVRVTLVEQLAQLGIKPEQIGRLGISHLHFDHIGQAPSFPGATLLIGGGDWTELTNNPPREGINPKPLTHWISGKGKVEPVLGDRDVFGDASVRMIDLPGHTPGHHGLMVKLKNKGNVLLSGDQAHFNENYATEGVPDFNTNRTDTLTSFKRFKDMAKDSNATVIIQHEPADIAKLPAFPQAAD